MGTLIADGCSILSSLRTVVSTLMSDNPPPPSTPSSGAELLLRLRNVARDISLSRAATESSLSSVSHALDVASLDLEGVLYEKAVVLNEIKRCAEFEFDPSSLNLLPLESVPEDPHSAMLASLANEKAAREELVRQLAEQEKAVGKTRSELAAQNEFLDGLGLKLNKFLAGGRSLAQYLGDPNIALGEGTRKLVGTLPHPLYLLYTQLLALNGGEESGMLRLAVRGEEGGDAGMGGGGRPVRRRKTLEDGEEHQEDKDEENGDVYAVYPANVGVSVYPDGDGNGNPSGEMEMGPLELAFYYYPTLDVVGVEVENPEVYPPGMLANLFPGDTGETSPNPANVYVRTAGGEVKPRNPDAMGDNENAFVFAPPRDGSPGSAGVPYLWVQWLAGKNYLDPAGDPSVALSVGVAKIVQQMQNRLVASRALEKHLHTLSTLTLPLADEVSSTFPLKSRVALEEWVQLDSPSAANALANDARLAALVSPESSPDVYRARFTRDGAVLTAHVVLTKEYPARPPLFGLALETPGSSGFDNNVTVMADEVNVYHSELPIPNDNDLLAYQVRKLALCFDIYIKSLASSSSSALLKSKLSLRTFRGRNRQMPFSFNESVGLFEQRLHHSS